MCFYIQASNPRSNFIFDKEDESLREAIETVFSLNCESAFIVWNNINISLSYKYDLSIMVDDILQMLQNLLEHENGQMEIYWASDTFSIIWKLDWNASTLKVNGVWHNFMGELKELLCQKADIVIEKEQFISEWKAPLEVISTALLKAGYLNRLQGLNKLLAIVGKIKGRGALY